VSLNEGPEALRWREDLVEAGFSDDGVRLRGPVVWDHPVSGEATARVEIEADDFPFAPPQVRVLKAGAPLELTFHIDRATKGRARGNLCLWEDSWSADVAPWLDAKKVIARIADWFLQTARGWPADRACDLERYLPQEDTLVLYDSDANLTGRARAERSANGAVRLVAGTLRPPSEARQPKDHRRLKRAGRPPEAPGGVWVCDVGPLHAPLRSWSEVEALLGENAAEVKREVELKRIRWMLLRYSRGGASGVLALHLGWSAAGVDITSCEAADTSVATRMLRAGVGAAPLSEVRVAIVGCGAVGSFIADTLFRSGLRHLDLRDHERLRPGNVVRHLAGLDEVGLPKVEAVRRALAKVDANTSTVMVDTSGVWTLEQAVALLQLHGLVVDATGSARATSLLHEAAQLTDHVVVSACVQRDGDVVRADRMPLRGGETYLPPLTRVDDDEQPRERGCGSPVSLTPPGAVVAAAELACRVVIDEVSGERSLPASLADVRRVQPEAPFDRLGLVVASSTSEPGAA